MSNIPDAVTSAELLQRAQAGDEAALNALLKVYLPRLRRWASGRAFPVDTLRDGEEPERWLGASRRYENRLGLGRSRRHTKLARHNPPVSSFDGRGGA